MVRATDEQETLQTHFSSSNVLLSNRFSDLAGITDRRRTVEFSTALLPDGQRHDTMPQFFLGPSLLSGRIRLPVHVCLSNAASPRFEIPIILSGLGPGISHRDIGNGCRNSCRRCMSKNRRRHTNVLHFPRLLRSHIAALSARILVIKINE